MGLGRRPVGSELLPQHAEQNGSNKHPGPVAWEPCGPWEKALQGRPGCQAEVPRMPATRIQGLQSGNQGLQSGNRWSRGLAGTGPEAGLPCRSGVGHLLHNAI